MIVAVDPGRLSSGVAVFTCAGVLAGAGLVEADPLTGVRDLPAGQKSIGAAVRAFAARNCGRCPPGCPHPDELAVELPQTYGGKAEQGDANDLIEVACVVGAVVEAFSGWRTTTYHPARWKGQAKKSVTRARLAEDLEEFEWQRIRGRGNHNVLDAIAIGLAHLAKLGRRAA